MPSGRSGSRGTSPTSRTCRPDVAGIDVAAGDETYYLGIRERSRTLSFYQLTRGHPHASLCAPLHRAHLMYTFMHGARSRHSLARCSSSPRRRGRRAYVQGRGAVRMRARRQPCSAPRHPLGAGRETPSESPIRYINATSAKRRCSGVISSKCRTLSLK